MYIGDVNITQLYLGDNDPSAAYIGDVQIYPATPFSGFEMTSSIEFPKSGGTMQIRIKSHTTWEIGTAANWLSFSQTTGSGNTYVTVTATDNDTEASRNATITGQTLDEVYSDQCDVEQVYRIPYETYYFTIRSLADNNTINVQNFTSPVLYCSTDGGNTWNTNRTFTLQSGDTLQIKGTTEYYNAHILTASTSYEVYGNSASLIAGDDFSGVTSASSSQSGYLFAGLFSGDTKIVSAEHLIIPWGQLKNSDCYRMFRGCTNLTSAPALPAMTLGNYYCYQEMFYGCTSLTKAPSVLPALACPQRAYNDMFTNCSSLVKAPEIMASAMTGQYGMAGMFNGCSSLVNVPDLHLMSFGYASCQSMFGNCTSLVKAPKLPATTLSNYCYYYMFENCTSLSAVTCLATNGTSGTNVSNWLKGVSATGTFTKAAGYTGWGSGTGGIPSNWTVVDYSE